MAYPYESSAERFQRPKTLQRRGLTLTRLAIVTVLSLVALRARELPSQTFTCASTSSDVAQALKSDIVDLVTGTAAPVIAARDSLHLLAASASQVSFVTQTNKCKNAGEAYHVALEPAGTPQISRSMVVIKVANSRYVFIDPAERQGEFGTFMVADASFNVLAKMTY